MVSKKYRCMLHFFLCWKKHVKQLVRKDQGIDFRCVQKGGFCNWIVGGLDIKQFES